jgi:hypothetical protein
VSIVRDLCPCRDSAKPVLSALPDLEWRLIGMSSGIRGRTWRVVGEQSRHVDVLSRRAVWRSASDARRQCRRAGS